MMRSNITGTTPRPVAWWRSTSSSVASGIELASGHHRAGHRRGEDQLGEAPGVEHGRHDHRGLLGPPRHAVQYRLERPSPAPPPECLAPLGVPVVPEVSRIILPLRRCAVGSCPAWSAMSFSTVRSCRARRSRPRCGGVRFVGQRAVDRRGELLVVDDGVDAFAVDDLGQRGPGERGVEQHHVRADPVGGHQRLDKAAVVAAHDADDLRLTRRAAVCSAAANALIRSSSCRQVSVPSSSTRPGRSGQRCAATGEARRSCPCLRGAWRRPSCT